MNKLRFPLILLLMFFVSGLAWVKITHAQSFSPQTSPGQKINSSLYSASQNVNIEGTINGDVYCVGQNVTIDATVHGDVLCAGQTVVIDGHIDGSLRVAAQTLTDGATVDRSVSVVTQTSTITKTASVGGDMSFIGQQMTMNGYIGRDIAAAASTLNINGHVARNVKFNGSALNLQSNARVKGDLSYTSQRQVSIASSAAVHGTISHMKPAIKKQSVRATFTGWAVSFVYFFAAMLLFGVTLVLLMPQTIRVTAEESEKHLGRAILNALGLVILEPIIIVGLFATIVGIPLALLCFLLFLLLAIFTLPITAFYVGTLIMSRTTNAILSMIVGMFVVTLLLMIPVLGIFAAIASFLIGAGAIVLALRKYLPTPVYKVK